MGVPVTFEPLSAEHWDWVKLRAQPLLCKDTRGLVAYRGQDLVAAVVFDNWTETSCQGHIAIEDPFVLKHGFAELFFGYVYNHADREIIIGLVPEDNVKSIRFVKHLGFTEVCRIRGASRKNVDTVIMELRREDCRWIQQPAQAA